MSVGDEQVQPAIVIVVEKASAEAKYAACGAGYACAVADFIKRTLSIVVPKMIGVVLEVGDEQIQRTVVVIVSKRDAHGRHHIAACRQGHAALQAYFLESAVVLVVIKICVDAIVGYK